MSSSSSKIVLVTGATAGIGRMTAMHLAKLGPPRPGDGPQAAPSWPQLSRRPAASFKLDTLALDVTSPDRSLPR